MTTTPREAPAGHKPSGRPYNRGEQTVEGGITYRPTTRDGKPVVEITNPTDFNRIYARSAKLFGGEAHHMADLAYIDKLLHRAGLTSGAHGSKNYSDERHRVLEMVNKKGAKTGDHIDNLMTLAQHGKKGSVQKYGQAHKFSHDLYKQIPELPDEQLRAMSLEELADYMVGQIRVRKKIVIDAAQYKLDQLYDLKPELRDAPESQVREFIADPKNRKLVGELGDSGFFDNVRVTPLDEIPSVKGALPGQVGIDPRTNMIWRGDPRSFLAVDPTAALAGGVKNMIKESPLGSAAGFAGALHDERLQEAVEEGDALKAGAIVVGDTALGATANLVTNYGAVSLAAKFPALEPALKAAAPIAGTVGGVATAVATAVAAPSSVDPVIQERKNEEWRSKQTPERLAQLDAWKDEQIPTKNGKLGPNVYQEPDPLLSGHIADRQRAMQKAVEHGPRLQWCLKGGNVCIKLPEKGFTEAVTGMFGGKEEREAVNGSTSAHKHS